RYRGSSGDAVRQTQAPSGCRGAHRMIRWRPRLPLVGNLVCGQIERVNPKITPKPFSEGKPGPPACGLGAPPVGRPRTSMRIRLGASGSRRAIGASGSRRAIGASGSRRAIGASGSQRAIGASGRQRAIGATFPNGSTAGRFVLKSNQKGGPANRRLYSCSSGSFFDENMLNGPKGAALLTRADPIGARGA